MQSREFAVILQRAAAALGGVEELSSRLRVSIDTLKRWMDGKTPAPVNFAFLHLVDILTAHAERQRTEALHAALEANRKKHEEAMLQAQALSSQNAQVLAEALATRLTSAAVRHEALRLRTARYVSCHEAALLPYRHPFAILDQGFVPKNVAALLAAALKAALIAADTDLGNLQIVCNDGSLRIEAQQGFEQPFLDFFATVEGAESACGVALRTCKQVIIADVRTDPLFAGTPAGAAMRDAGSVAIESTPLVDESSGVPLGMISTHHRSPGARSKDQLALLEVICKRASSWLEPALT